MAEFYEFFAGGGMARTGLGPDWRCLFANDFDPGKAAALHAGLQGQLIRTLIVDETTARALLEQVTGAENAGKQGRST